jgi:hypothetical protein
VNAGVTLNFNNRTVQGSGAGTGVRILGDGVRILTGTGNLNSTIKGFVTGVSGTTNNSQNSVFANGMNGIAVRGDANTIAVNTIGDKAKGNGVIVNGVVIGDGIQVNEASNRPQRTRSMPTSVTASKSGDWR